MRPRLVTRVVDVVLVIKAKTVLENELLYPVAMPPLRFELCFTYRKREFIEESTVFAIVRQL